MIVLYFVFFLPFLPMIREEDGFNVLDGTDYWTITPSKTFFVKKKKLHITVFVKIYSRGIWKVRQQNRYRRETEKESERECV